MITYSGTEKLFIIIRLRKGPFLDIFTIFRFHYDALLRVYVAFNSIEQHAGTNEALLSDGERKKNDAFQQLILAEFFQKDDEKKAAEAPEYILKFVYDFLKIFRTHVLSLLI